MAAGARGAPRPAWASPARCGSEGPTSVQSSGGSCVTFRPPGRSTDLRRHSSRDPASHPSSAVRAHPVRGLFAPPHAARRGFDLEDLLKGQPLEERIYRFRCVEAWSLVVPWVGFPLGKLLARFKPTSRAKYVELTTLYAPQQMPGQRAAVLNWPYVEGL